MSVDSVGAPGNRYSFLGGERCAMSGDGNLVVFDSDATDLEAGDGSKTSDVFLRHRCDAAGSNDGSGFTGMLLTPSFTGGETLADATFFVPVSLPAVGTTFTDALPNDPGLCEFKIDLQAIESDPGALKGISFTPGLELVLGH